MIWAAAKFTASNPEAQKRLICTPGTFLAESGVQRGETRNVATRLADRIDDAEHDVVDTVLGKVVALLQRLQRHR